ncbi:MAG: hypothetical protein DWB48_02260 [Nitrosomonas sp.]|nr:hypothetical protein [Nitrosomonas sp.]MDL1865568.1 hypothetical protein [Betaproteobacteria bacterium PRO5]
MQTNPDRLYELLPAIYRMRDAEQGEPLKALLRIMTEQVDVVEDNIAQLYENWFIETCEDWVVPYIADLIGYRPIHEAGEPGDALTEQGRLRNRTLIPRREVANTIRYRRCKGTLALLELLVNDIAGWPARAVEYYKLLGCNQALNYQHPERGRTVDVRNGDQLAMLNSPFDQLAHTVDVRRINSELTVGRHNIPSVGVFVWRLKAYSVTQTPAYCMEAESPHCFTFSVLGNNAPLFVKPEPETDPIHITDEFNLPVPIRRRLPDAHFDKLYGEDKSFFIWKGARQKGSSGAVPEPLKEKIIIADLSGWRYIPHRGTVAVDPVLGRIAFPPKNAPKYGVWVSYCYGFSADIGGGEYIRQLSQLADCKVFYVGQNKGEGECETINKALNRWKKTRPVHAVIEIVDSRVYVEPVHIEFAEGQQSLQLRAANGKRPVIRLLDWRTSQSDALTVTGSKGERFTLDGVMVTGRGVQFNGNLGRVTIRHATLVPGWSLDSDCQPQCVTEPSLEIFSPQVCVVIEHSIVGSIQIDPVVDELSETQPDHSEEGQQTHCAVEERVIQSDPIRLCISDSVIDATRTDREAIGGPGCSVGYAILSVACSTIFGQVQVHAIELGENSIFDGRVTVARRQYGCLRFSYVTPGSRTPSRFQCQPDGVESAVEQSLREQKKTEDEIKAAKVCEQLRVKPQFSSVRYGRPAYCQLASNCAPEIKRGAEDESEMGVFHDLFHPQRAANIRIRLDEYVPAGADVGIIFAS